MNSGHYHSILGNIKCISLFYQVIKCEKIIHDSENVMYIKASEKTEK